MKIIHVISVLLFMFIGLSPLTRAAGNTSPAAGVQAPAAAGPQDAYQQKIKALMAELRNAKTTEQRSEISKRLLAAREEYRAAHPVIELTPAEKEARRLKMEENLKKDPYRWQLYQLHQSMMKAKTEEERKPLQAQLRELEAKHAAEAEAKLTPEQKAARQARQEKNEKMRAELKPLTDQLRSAKTDEARKSIQAQMQEIYKKYR